MFDSKSQGVFTMARDGIETGAVDFVRKPFRMPELMARIRHHLGP
jgi:DNA-binding response OmpR family regulator